MHISSSSFDHRNNCHFNRKMIRNALAVSDRSEEAFDVALIKRKYVHSILFVH